MIMLRFAVLVCTFFLWDPQENIVSVAAFASRVSLSNLFQDCGTNPLGIHTALFVKLDDTTTPPAHTHTKISNKDWRDGTIIPPPQLTILLPAYNEQDRITFTLAAYTDYLQKSTIWGQPQPTNPNSTSSPNAKIMVVNDGSTDNTHQVVSDFQKNYMHTNDNVVVVDIQCVSYSSNRGKGAAIAHGIKTIVDDPADFTDLLLIADADGSGDISSGLNDMVQVLYETMISTSTSTSNSNGNNPPPSSSSIPSKKTIWNSSPCLVVGNRGYQGVLSWKRTITRWGFRTCVQLVCGNLQCQDTQCGFKLVNIVAASTLYQHLYLKGWTHDVEVLYRAAAAAAQSPRSCQVREVKIQWQDKEGSKLITPDTGGIVRVSMRMLREILQMRVHYLFFPIPLEEE